MGNKSKRNARWGKGTKPNAEKWKKLLAREGTKSPVTVEKLVYSDSYRNQIKKMAGV